MGEKQVSTLTQILLALAAGVLSTTIAYSCHEVSQNDAYPNDTAKQKEEYIQMSLDPSRSLEK